MGWRWACAAVLVSVLGGCGTTVKVAQLVGQGRARELRERGDDQPASSPLTNNKLLILLFDGIDRDTLYSMLREGQLPALAALLSDNGTYTFPHAHFDDRMIATLPSSTMAAWTTTITGLPPAIHGVTGNEFFIREASRLGAPAPVTFSDAEPSIAIYTDGYLDSLKAGPTIYEQMRERDPDILVWVTMHSLYAGADKVLVAKRTILAKAFQHFVEEHTVDMVTGEKDPRGPYATLDKQAIGVTVDALEDGPIPDVLTVYLAGADLYAHVAKEGPDVARRGYMSAVADPALGKLYNRLAERHALDDRYIVVVADHGHTQVVNDESHAMSAKGDTGPAALMRNAGYQLRPFKREVPKTTPFDAVWVAGGATAYVYVADRSTCESGAQPCDWTKPPRFDEDVVPLAEAFFRASKDGTGMPNMKGSIDMVLTREPVPFDEIDAPFEVYVGHGHTMPIAAYLAKHPHPSYVDMETRLADLATGIRGERAGDIMLLATNGEKDTPEERFYFADPYCSWHGSPSRRDSELPFIVAHRHKSARTIKTILNRQFGEKVYPESIANALLNLRYGTTDSTFATRGFGGDRPRRAARR